MPKDFWGKCIKRFFSFTIPALIALITVFSYFSSQFEDSLKQFGIFGAIIICLLCFSLTLLYGMNEMIKVVDFVGNEYLQDSKIDIKFIYKSFTKYQDNIKKQNKNGIINVNQNLNKEKQIVFFNNYLGTKEIFGDALQELSFIAMANGFTSMSDFFNMPVIGDVPKSMNDVNIMQLRKNVGINYKYNVLVDFYGKINGSVLLCFSEELKKLMDIIIKMNYYQCVQSYDEFIYSFLYELGSIFTGTCLMQFHTLSGEKFSWDENSHKVLNFKIKPNIDTKYLKVHDSSDNIYAIKLEGNTNVGHFLTSYILFDKENVEELLHKFI